MDTETTNDPSDRGFDVRRRDYCRAIGAGSTIAGLGGIASAERSTVLAHTGHGAGNYVTSGMDVTKHPDLQPDYNPNVAAEGWTRPRDCDVLAVSLSGSDYLPL